MRALFTVFLVGVLLACPILCRTADDACCVDHEATSETPDEHHAGIPSGDTANCICGGAVKATEDRDTGPGPGCVSPAPGTAFSYGLWLHRCSLTLQHARGGSPPEDAGWRGPRRVHALIKHFRC